MSHLPLSLSLLFSNFGCCVSKGSLSDYSYCLNQVTFRRDTYVLKVWWDGLCTERGEQQPSPIKLGCPDSSVSKMVCFSTSYIPLRRGFELH